MNKQPLISVIVPVYNVEKYLDRCVASIVNQTYRNLEIILVNDGSTDSSGKLCDEWAGRDERICVIHQKNAGLAVARNTGMSMVKGDYIAFVDSDDWLATDAYHYMFSLAERYEAEVVDIDVCETNQEIDFVNSSVDEVVLEQKEVLRDYMWCGITVNSPFSACRKLYKTASVEKIRFEEGVINEDIVFNYLVLYQVKKIVKSTKVCYFYFQDGISTTRGGLKKKDFDLLKVSRQLLDLSAKETYGNIAYLGQVKYARSFFSLLCKIAFYGIADISIDRKETITFLTKSLRKYLWLLLTSPMPLNRKICAILLAINIKCLEWPLVLVKRIR